MKRDSIWAIVAGILLTIVLVLIVEELLFPNEVAVYLIPFGVFIVFLWLNAYRMSRKNRSRVVYS